MKKTLPLSGLSQSVSVFDIQDIKQKIEDLLGTYDFQEVETYKQFKDAVRYLEIAYIYVHRVDWLVSGDDGEVEFHKRLAKDLKKLKK